MNSFEYCRSLDYVEVLIGQEIKRCQLLDCNDASGQELWLVQLPDGSFSWVPSEHVVFNNFDFAALIWDMLVARRVWEQ